MNVSVLIKYLDVLERNGLLPKPANEKIQQFLDFSTKSSGKLFLIMSGLLGAIFASAGVFAIISHNWDDFPKHLKGVMSIVPSLIALYFYYVALFKHNKSVVWIEASSMFLMLMIGASIALVAQTYQMNGDFREFIKLWLILTIPLFYLGRASGIAIFYLPLSLIFLEPHIDWFWFSPRSFDTNESYYLYLLFLVPVIIHFYLILDKKSHKQGFRAIFLGWLLAITFFCSFPFFVQAGYLWWGLAILIGYYILGKRYFSDNISHLGRPFQTFTLYSFFFIPLYMTNDLIFDYVFKYEGLRNYDIWTGEEMFYYIFGVMLIIGLTILAVLQKIKGADLNRYIIFMPGLIVFLYLIYLLDDQLNFDMRWLGFLTLNFYILGFAINAMIMGNKSKNILYMFYGLFLVAALLSMRYSDMDIAFWLKGIFFIGVGGLFFLINYLSTDELEN